MPEVHFTLRWPDGAEQRCYSPSTIVTEYLAAGQSYPLDEFMARARDALNKASERVAAKYGFACTSAMAQLEQIETVGATFSGQPGAIVTCKEISR